MKSQRQRAQRRKERRASLPRRFRLRAQDVQGVRSEDALHASARPRRPEGIPFLSVQASIEGLLRPVARLVVQPRPLDCAVRRGGSCFLNLLDGSGAPPKGIIVCLTANCTSGFDEALVRAGGMDRVVAVVPPKEPEILAALRCITHDGREDRHAAFRAKAKKLQRSLCMSSITDHLLRHPSDYLETVEEFGRRSAAKDALVKEEADDMYA